MNSIPKVPVGPTTVLGVGTGVSALVAAVVAFIAGDRSEQTVGTIVGGVVGGVLLGITFVGRYVQSWLLTRHHLQITASAQTKADLLDSEHRLTEAITEKLRRQVLDYISARESISKAAQGEPKPSAPPADQALDDPLFQDPEPVIADTDLEGRHAASEPVGHGDADMRDSADGGGTAEQAPAPAAVGQAAPPPESTQTAGNLTTPAGAAQ